MWQLWLYLSTIGAVLIGLVLTAYERLRPAQSPPPVAAVLLPVGTPAVLPVIAQRVLDKPGCGSRSPLPSASRRPAR